MPGAIEHRGVSPVINFLRNILRGAGHRNPLRFADDIAARTQPPPNIPGGPYHKTSKIYYFTRDARREVAPPQIITANKQLGSGGQVSDLKPATPGKVFQWD